MIIWLWRPIYIIHTFLLIRINDLLYAHINYSQHLILTQSVSYRGKEIINLLINI